MDFAHDFAASAAPASEKDDEESYLDDAIEIDLIDDPGDDDQESTGLDVGEEIEDLLAEGAGDNEPVELDLGSFIGADERRADDTDEHDTGIEVDPAVGLELPEALLPDDGREGLDDGAITIDESKFPSLEADDGSEGIAAEREISLGSAGDEAKVPLAPVAWSVLKPKASFEACAALAARGANVVAASSDLLWFRSDSSAALRLAIDGSALSDLVLPSATQDVALATTQSGQLFRRARFASQAEQLSRLRDYYKPSPGTRAALSFGGALDSSENRVLLHSQDGALLDVLDAGDRFARIDLPGKALAVARESATVLVARERERLLVSLDGPEQKPIPLSGAALAVARGNAPLLATHGECVAMAEFGQSITVSADRGHSFRRVSGTANTTALSGARVGDAARFFAAVYRETTDQSEILLVDPELGEALCIARLDGGDESSTPDPVDRGEWARVTRLLWHGATGHLWAVGGFGVLSFAPPELP
ncbi:MAG TPA: hypothetical protein VK745_21910 [Polyangiaceae bacterium]|nr:hypothetical protein [Polyangiaceae bacterium]